MMSRIYIHLKKKNSSWLILNMLTHANTVLRTFSVGRILTHLLRLHVCFKIVRVTNYLLILVLIIKSQFKRGRRS